MFGMKIVLLLVICFFSLFLLKKFVFQKIFMPFLIFILILFKEKMANDPEAPPSKKVGRAIVIVGWVYAIFDFLERWILFIASTAIIYNILTFISHILISNQLLATYISSTTALIVICYMSRYYGFIYALLNGRKKVTEKNTDVHESESDAYTNNLLNALSEAFDKRAKIEEMLSSVFCPIIYI